MPRRAVIVANGAPGADIELPALVRSDDLLIAANGGGWFCLAARRVPQYVIGDFDSLAPEDLEALVEQGAEVVRHPTRKDETDLELAIDLAIEKGADDILIVAGLGGRWDQTLANLLLLALPRFAPARLRLVDDSHDIFLLRPGKSHPILGCAGDTVSLIPIEGDARGVTTSGLAYPLADGTLPFGATLGVSNTLTTPEATVTLQDGLLVCIVIHGSRR